MAISKTALLRWLAKEERKARNRTRLAVELEPYADNLRLAHALALVHTWVQRPVKAKRKKAA